MTSNWQTILRQVESLQEEARRGGYPLWYRGHCLSEWKLQSSLHRHVESGVNTIRRQFTQEERVEMMRDIFKSLYRKYKARAWHLLSHREMSDWGIIFSMQHHGVPTRLLDWTKSFVCALYFAHYGRKPSDEAAIFVLSPEHLNHSNFGYRGQLALGEDIGHEIEIFSYHPGYAVNMRPLHTIGVAPVLTNPRMLAQQSVFTLSGDPFQSLEERYKDFIVKIVLPPETYDESRRFLDLVGIGHFGYFPDLEGLRNELVGNLEREIEIAKDNFNKRAV